MEKDAAKQYFLSLEPRERGLFLALLSHNLTVAARGHYDAARQPGDPAAHKAALEALNEVQHHLSAHFRKLLGDEKAGFPDEAVMDVLYGWPNMSPLAKADFQWAIETSARYHRADTSEIAGGTRSASVG